MSTPFIASGFRTTLTFDVPIIGTDDCVHIELLKFYSKKEQQPIFQLQVDVVRGVLYEEWKEGSSLDRSVFSGSLAQSYDEETYPVLVSCVEVALHWFEDMFPSGFPSVSEDDVTRLAQEMSECSGGLPHNIVLSCNTDFWQA